MENKNSKPVSCEAPKPADKKAKDEMNKQGGSCCSCEADFKNEIDQLVDEVEGYGRNDRKMKQEEIEEAFGK